MKSAGWPKVLIALSTVLMLLQPTGSTAMAQPQADIKIAMLAPLSGGAASFGAEVKKGISMAVDEWNANGGVLGRTVTVVDYDTQCDAALAQASANSVVTDGIHYIIGDVCSKASIPISDIADAHHIVQITPVSTNEAVTVYGDGSVKQYVFRACFIDSFQGQMMAHFAISKGMNKVYILHDPANIYSIDLADAFYRAYSGEVVGYDTYSAGMSDFTDLLNRIKSSGANAVYLPDYYGIANTIVHQAKNLGLTATFLGGDGWDSVSLDKTATQGSFYTIHFSPDNPDPAVQQWVSKFNTKYNETPDSQAALSYDSTNLLLEAIQAAGVDDPAAVKDALAQGDFTEVTGNIRFDDHHNPQKNVVVQQIDKNISAFYTSFLLHKIFLSAAQKNLTAGGTPVKACLVTDIGGVNDSGFNASAWQGMLDAQGTLGASVSYLESPTADDYAKEINTFISAGCDLIETVGFGMMQATHDAAVAHPTQKFSIVDAYYDPVLNNVLGQSYSTEQNSFLVGYLAAGSTKTNKVSTFGGMKIDVVTQFMDGYVQGVEYYNQENSTNVQVIGWDPKTQTGDFTDDFGNETAGKAMAQSQLDQGADIVFPVAGQTALGAAQAVKNQGNAWVIGVDTDWVKSNSQYTSIVLTSAIKNIRAATSSTVLSVSNKTFSGGKYLGTLKNNGVSLGTISSSVPADLIFKMDQVKAGIIAGSIKVNP